MYVIIAHTFQMHVRRGRHYCFISALIAFVFVPVEC